MKRRIEPLKTLQFIREIVNSKALELQLDCRKHSVLANYDGNNIAFELKLPLPFPTIEKDEGIESYIGRVTGSFPPYAIILIQANYCALGYFEDGNPILHKSIQTYATRKKQGRSQLTYGKSGSSHSTAGSQLRYRNAINVFEKINETLCSWDVAGRANRILYSCPINLHSFFFKNKVKSGLAKNDPRLQKIPLDVRPPNHEELCRVNHLISFGYLTTTQSTFDQFPVFKAVS